MKKLSTLLFVVAIMFSFSRCNNASTDKVCSDATSRAAVISTLINDHNYTNELMDSVMSNSHASEMLHHKMMEAMMKDTAKGSKMMSHMLEMCKSDSSMCKMMVGKTLDMCCADSALCKMMCDKADGCMKKGATDGARMDMKHSK